MNQKKDVTNLLYACTDNYDPIQLLKHLSAKIGYNAGYVIRLTDDDRERITNVIRFHTEFK